MDYEPYPRYTHVDQELVDKIVCKLKSQGLFDQFRKDCLADVDTKPAYQNLQQRVNGTVANFLANHKWRHDLNKNQLRENLRRHVQQDFLEVGVSRIVDQVVNPKICPVFLPQVEDVVYDCLGIEKPKPKKTSQSLHLSQSRLPVKRSCSPLSLLPHDLDPISPESDHQLDDESLHDDNTNKDESRNSLLAENINNDDSHLSGISELTSHGSVKDLSEVACMSEKSNILADRTNHEIPTNSPSHKTPLGYEHSISSGSDFDNFSNLKEKLKKADHLNGNPVKKDTNVCENSDCNIESIDQGKEDPMENTENQPSQLKTFHLDNSTPKPDKEESLYDSSEQQSNLSVPLNCKNEDIKIEEKIVESLTKNNGVIYHNETSMDIICKSEKPDDSLSNVSKYSEDSRSSDFTVKDKISRSNKQSESKQSNSKREYKKTEYAEKQRNSKIENKQYKSEGQTKLKNETDSEYNSSDKDQKSDHNSSDKESSKKIVENKLINNTSEIKYVDVMKDISCNNKEVKSTESISKGESSSKSERKSSSGNHHSSSRDKKHESSREHKSREHKHERDKDSTKHRTSSDKRDESKDKKYKDKSLDNKKHDARDEKDKQRTKKDKPDEKEIKNSNSEQGKNEASSSKSKEHKYKDEQTKHTSDKEKHKSNKDESKDKKEKSSDRKDHYKHKEEGDKRDKEKYKDDKQRSSKNRHDKNGSDKISETRKSTEVKLDEKHVNEDKNHHKRNSSCSDSSKRSSSLSDKISEKSEKDEKSKEKERSSKKRKGERCKEEVKHKEARRSTDRDSNGRGSSGIIDKGSQQSQKDNKYISSNNSQNFENSATDRNSCSDSMEVRDNSEIDVSISKSENPISEDQQDVNEIDLILQKINSSIEEVQAKEDFCDEPDSSADHSDSRSDHPINETNSVVEVKKPKIAKNIFEIRKIMQARKNIDRKRRKDIMKKGFLKRQSHGSDESNEFIKQVTEVNESDTHLQMLTKTQSLNRSVVNENVDSNNFVESRDCDILDSGLKNDKGIDSLSKLCNDGESSDEELFKGFNENEVSLAVQKVSKALCYTSNTVVKLSPLKLDDEVLYKGKYLGLSVDFQSVKKTDARYKSKHIREKNEILLDKNLNNLNTRPVCIDNINSKVNLNIPSEQSDTIDSNAMEGSNTCIKETDMVKGKSDFKTNNTSSHVQSNQCTEGDNSDSKKSENGCFVVVHVTDVSEKEKFQSPQEESVSSNLPVIISPDHCYDSDVNYDENYGLNESFCSDFGGSKPLSVSLTETMLENLMKESNLISDFSRTDDVSSSDDGWNGYAKISAVPNESSHLTVNISESSSYITGQNAHETDVISSSDAKRKGSSFEAPEPKKPR